MEVRQLIVFSIYISTVACSSLNVEQDDMKAILGDIVKRLDEKEDIIHGLEAAIGEQQFQLHRQQAILTEHQNVIQQQQSAMAGQQERIMALELMVFKQEPVHDSPDTPNSQEETYANGGTDIKINDEDNGDSDKTASDELLAVQPGSFNRIRRVENAESIAFLASMSDHDRHVGADQNIAFDRVITNVGNAYHPAAGAFIAPVSGIYVFSTTLMSFGELANAFQIQHNGSKIIKLQHHPSTASYETAAVTIVLEMAEGDDVSVVNMGTDKTIQGNNFCSFTGFLLEQTYSAGSVIVGK